MGRPKHTPPEYPGNASPRAGPLDAVLSGLVAGLLVARLLVPAEASVLGDTLGLVQLWFAAGVLWAWNSFRTGEFSLRVGWLDAALWLLIAGHAVSGLSVFVLGGDRRAVLNLVWEWIALGVSFFLVRQILVTRTDARRLLLVMTATVTALAGLGLWQHYGAFPQNVARYERLRVLEERSPGDPEVRRELAEMGVPDSAVSRTLWEERLRSAEPFGTFALANTLAGILVAWWIVATAAVVRGWPHVRGWPSRLGALGAALLIGYCLVLTKSRTAAVGAVAGLAAWGGLAFVDDGRGRRWIRWLLAAVAAVGVLVAAAALTGGLDRQVLSEAPKSLRYRLQFWKGTAAVIREHPLLGTGPGNFRQHYLKHKLPESSEEILDPHNFVLDVWTSGGVVGLFGLFWLLVAGAGALARGRREFEHSPPGKPKRQERLWTALTVGGAVGFVLLLAVGLILGDIDERIAALLAGWLLAVALLRRPFLRADLSSAAVGAGCVALLVHLLGAGGIEMPAVTQTLLVLLAVGTVLAGPQSGTTVRSRRTWVLATGAAAAGLFVACLGTATVPVFNRQSLVAAGDAALRQDRNPELALRFYSEAADQDSLSPEPVERLADTAFYRWKRSSAAGEGDFERAVEFAKEAIRRDPFSANGYRRPGVWYLEHFRRTGRPESAAAAVEFLSEAVERYSNSAAIRAELAQALAAAGEAAQEQARMALELDAINRREGHRDKFLPPEIIESLRQIVAGTVESPNRRRVRPAD